MKLKEIVIVLTSLAMLAGAKPALANSHTWSGAVNGNWSNSANWSSGGAPGIFETPPVILEFPSGVANYNTTNDIGCCGFYLQVDAVIVNGNNYLFTGNTNSALVMTGNPIYNNFYCAGTSNVFDYSLQIYLAATNTVYVGPGASLSLNGQISGPGGLGFDGPGSTYFQGLVTNTFTGTMNVQYGTVYLDNFTVDDYGLHDYPVMGGSLLIIGGNNPSLSATVYVQRNNQFTTNCDIVLNPSGQLLVDREYAELWDYYEFYNYGDDDYQLQCASRSLTLNGGEVYLGKLVYYRPDYYGGVDTGTNLASLTVGSNLVSAASVATVEGPGLLDLSGRRASITSGQLLLAAGSKGFTKSGFGLLTLAGPAAHSDLTIAQGLGTLTVPNAISINNLTVSNGAEMDISAPCSLGGNLELHGRGLPGNAGALTISSSVVTCQLQGNVVLGGDTGINIVNPTDQLTIWADGNSYVSGTNDLYKLGAGTLLFADFAPNSINPATTNSYIPLSNLFSGTLYVQGGTVELNSAAPPLVPGYNFAKPNGIALNGPIVIGTNGGYSSCYVQLDSSEQLATNVSVTINPGGELYITGTNYQTAGALNLNGGIVYGGTLMLNGDVTAQNAAGYSSAIYSTLSLNGAYRNLNVASLSSLYQFGNIIDGGNAAAFTKTGPGDLNLYSIDSCSGITVVSAGRLGAFSSGAFVPTAFALMVSSGAELLLYDGVNIGAANLWLAGAGTDGLGALKSFGTNSWAGVIGLLTNATIGVVSNASWPASQLELSGVIGGTGNLTKTGWGSLLLDGSQSNTFTGTMVVQQGPVFLNKSGGGAIPGPLTIGLGLDAPNSDAVHALLNNQLSPSNLVAISSSGLLDIGGSISTSIGSLTGSGTLQLGVGGLTCGLDNTSTSFAGAITGSASGSMLKNGTGTFTLTGTSPFAGIVQCGAGQLFVNGSLASAVISVNNGATLGGTGTVGPFGFTRGIVAPGVNGPGILNSGNLLLNTHDTFLAHITGVFPGTYSELKVTGTVTLGNAALQLAMSYLGFSNSTLTLIKNNGAGAVSGTFTNLPEGATFTMPGGAQFKISYKGGLGGKDVVLTQTSLPPQPKISGISKSSGGVQLTGTGYTNTSYTVWATTDLVPANWLSIGTATANGSGTLQFTDTNAPSFSHRFYRFSWP